MDKKIASLPTHRMQEEQRRSWDGFITIVNSKLAVLRMALGGIENVDNGDYDWLEDVKHCRCLIDEADINERPDVGCLMDLTLEILEFADKYFQRHPDLDDTGTVLLEKIGLIRMALEGFRTNDQAIYLGGFVQELMNYLDMSYYGGRKDEVKEKIRDLIQDRKQRSEHVRMSLRDK